MCISGSGESGFPLCQAHFSHAAALPLKSIGMAMDGAHESSDVFRRRQWDDAMAKVEDVAGRGTGGADGFMCRVGDRIGTGPVEHWIEEPLHWHAATDPMPRRADVHGPVHTEAGRAALREVIEP